MILDHIGPLIHERMLPHELDNDNRGRRKSEFVAAKRRKKIAELLWPEFRKTTPYAEPVVIVITRILGKGQAFWDPDSIGRGSAKELIDTLVELDWFHDDSHKYIRGCIYDQDDSRRAIGPTTKISVYQWVDVPIVSADAPDRKRIGGTTGKPRTRHRLF